MQEAAIHLINRTTPNGANSRQILGLALPMALEMSMQSLVILVDAFFVARLGSMAVAAVGLTAVALALLLTVAWGFGEAAAAMVARRVGAGQHAAAAKVAATALLMGALTGAVLSLVGAAGSHTFLAWVGGSAELVTVGGPYAMFLIAGSLPLWGLVIGNSVLRAAGKPHLALRVLVVANSINLVLDPCLIFGWGPFPDLGLTGAALASVLGWIAGALYLGLLLFRGQRRFGVCPNHGWWEPGAATRLVALAWPVILGYLATEIALLMLFRLVAVFGATALAAFTLCTRFQIAHSLSDGLSNAAKTLTGQSLGAGRADQAESAVWRVATYNLFALVSVGSIYVFLGDRLLGFFTDDPQVIALAWQCQLWVSASYVFHAFGGVLEQAFIGAGDTTTPALVNTGGLWLCQLPLAYLLGVSLDFGAVGVFAALGISQSLLALAMIVRFRRGGWKACRI